MTLPVAVGYPDFGRYSARSKRVYLDDTFTGLPTNPDPPQEVLSTFVGDVPRISVFATATVSAATVTVEFHDADPAGGSNIVSRETFTVTINRSFAHSFATFGPFVRITAGNVLVSGNISVRVMDTTQPGNNQNGTNDSDNILVGSELTVQPNTSVGVGAQRVWPGMASWSVAIDPVLSSALFISVLMPDSVTTVNLLRCDDLTVFRNGRLCLPPLAVTMTVSNFNLVDPLVATVTLLGLLSQAGI